jgi:hypothetical protein
MDWPRSSTTNEVFDDDWLRRGTGPLSASQIERAQRAARGSFGSDMAPATKAEIAEYWRTKNRAVRNPLQVVRGFDIAGWQDHVDHMKRTGLLEDALALAYECADAAERAASDVYDAWPKWAVEIAIILRKIGDLDSEVRHLSRAASERPGNRSLEARLRSAIALKERKLLKSPE